MLDDFSVRQMESFFNGIDSWRSAYKRAWFTYVAKRDGKLLKIIAARIFFDLLPNESQKELFDAGDLQAGQFLIDEARNPVEVIIRKVMSPEGWAEPGHGTLILSSNEQYKPSFSMPALLHPEGTRDGNRIAVLTASGVNVHDLMTQPETDWMLKAAVLPYDSFNELCSDYALGIVQRDRATLEVVARTAVQVSLRSSVSGAIASVGVWAAESADSEKIRLNIRVLDKRKVVERKSILGIDLKWEDVENGSRHGLVEVKVPQGAAIQCIACYGGYAHDQRWFADPRIFQNPRNAKLSVVDPGLKLIRAYLMPDLPARGRAADDFEVAVTWMLWALGFAPINFGLQPKTTDAMDIIAVAPRGDCLVIECTTGLLKAESKLSKLTARAAKVRKSLDASEMQHLKVVPVIVTAMTRYEVSSELGAANELGVAVIAREDLEASFTEILGIPDADALLSRLSQSNGSKPFLSL